MRRIAAALLLLAPAPAAAAAEAGERTALGLTVYDQGAALVEDRRRVDLPAGESVLELDGVPRELRPETLVLGGDSAPAVLERRFDRDLLTPQALLQAAVGETVTVLRTNPATGAVTSERAEVLAAEEGVVLRYADPPRIETGLPERVAYESVPEGLRARPTLSLRLDSAEAGPRPLTLRYLTGGLSWQADYVAEIAPDRDSLRLAGWATLDNRSAMSWPAAEVALMAGEVRRGNGNRGRTRGAEMALAASPAADAAPRREALAGLHLYHLPRKVALDARQSVQVALMPARTVEMREILVARAPPRMLLNAVRGRQEGRPLIRLVLENTEAAGLGRPLPGGTVRAYRTDSRGTSRFAGSAAMDHAAVGRPIRLDLGRDFDVTVERVQQDFRQVSRRPQVIESRHRVTVHNGKPDRAVTLRLEAAMPGDWRILEESRPHEAVDSGTVAWILEVPADGTTRLDYAVRVRR